MKLGQEIKNTPLRIPIPFQLDQLEADAYKVGPEQTVYETCKQMKKYALGAVVIQEEGKEIAGIFSERDLLLRVVLEQRNPLRTKVSEVMTIPVTSVTEAMSGNDIVNLMAVKNYRQLPVVNKNGEFLRMVSTMDLLKSELKILRSEYKDLTSFTQSDGIGG